MSQVGQITTDSKYTHPRTGNLGTSILQLEDYLSPHFSSTETVAEAIRSITCNFGRMFPVEDTQNRLRLFSTQYINPVLPNRVAEEYSSPKGHMLYRHQGNV
jgi:hypothetical protein